MRGKDSVMMCTDLRDCNIFRTVLINGADLQVSRCAAALCTAETCCLPPLQIQPDASCMRLTSAPGSSSSSPALPLNF
jgi:hypothetical protein